MKKLFVIISICFIFTISSNAQSSMSSESTIPEAALEKFTVSYIKVLKAPDADDLGYVEVAIREELIHSQKIKMDIMGDTLFVKLIVQHTKPKGVSFSNSGRDGKYGEMCLTIVSKDGKAAATARGYIREYDGELYYNELQNMAQRAASRFEFVK